MTDPDFETVLTDAAVQVAAALREQVAPPTQWEVLTERLGPPDDPDAPVVLIVRLTRPVGTRTYRWMHVVSPYLVRDSAVGAAGVVRMLLRDWGNALIQALESP